MPPMPEVLAASVTLVGLASSSSQDPRPGGCWRPCQYAQQHAGHEPPTTAGMRQGDATRHTPNIGIGQDRRTFHRRLAWRGLWRGPLPIASVGLRNRAILVLKGMPIAYVVVPIRRAERSRHRARGWKIPAKHSTVEGANRKAKVPSLRLRQALGIAQPKALMTWLSAAGITEGPVSRPINRAGTVSQGGLTDKSMANIVKPYAGRIG